jgi:VanZ family protein
MSAVRQSLPTAAKIWRAAPRALVLAWAPVLVWMAFIFSLSGERFSDENTAAWLSGIIGPLGISPDVIKIGNLIVRKCAHFVEYAVLGVLTLRALRATWPWRRSGQLLLIAVVVAAAWATLDELHQYLDTASRGGRPQDVVLDTAGALAGVAVGCAYRARRMRRGA